MGWTKQKNINSKSFAFFNAQNLVVVADITALITCSSKHNNEDDYAEEEARMEREKMHSVRKCGIWVQNKSKPQNNL